jgi:hypothetical protein
MRNIEFRLLKAQEIEVRVQSVKNGKANMLLYIDSRCVTTLLNETVGALNWQSKFYQVGNMVMGKLGIWCSEKEAWVWKSDTGSESNIEAEKGLISDTYKRLLSRWGVVELYSAPRIEIPDDGYGNTGYKVSEIAYEERKITHLVIVNRFGKEVFRWDLNAEPRTIVRTPQSETNKQLLIDFCKANNTDANRLEMIKFYNFYIHRVVKWTGEINLSKLWEKWNKQTA